ncbi:MAG: amino acid permease-associated protein, partial [Candidatus Eremiobacteraeota bacterium]|nr:amino acid permease-associated protein [Candidatus Eremiobacteraeota bacterium]
FTLGRWGVPVTIGGALYLLLMLLNIVWPSPLTSGRALFNYGWVTLLVMIVIVGAGAVYEAIARPDRSVSAHRIEAPETGGRTL